MADDLVLGPQGVHGREVLLGDGKKYVVAGLAFGPLKRLQAAMVNDQLSPMAKADALTAALHNSLKRNYPELTAEQVEDELLTVDTKDVAQRAMMGLSQPKAEEAKPGEA